jgi:hypothetical protein
MNLNEYRAIFGAIFLILVLVAASPALNMIITGPAGERFNELWVLGPEDMASNYPLNVRENEYYNISLGVGNHMGELEYYVVYAKFRNQTEPLANVTTGTPSPLKAFTEYRIFLSEGEVWERSVTFSFSGITFGGNSCRVSRLGFGDSYFQLNKTTSWNSENRGYFFQLFFELWWYNSTTSGFQFNNRFVSILLNMTGMP